MMNSIEQTADKIRELFQEYSGYIIYNKKYNSKKELVSINLGFEFYNCNNLYSKIIIEAEVIKTKNGKIKVNFLQDFILILQSIDIEFSLPNIKKLLDTIINFNNICYKINNLLIHHDYGCGENLIYLKDLNNDIDKNKYSQGVNFHFKIKRVNLPINVFEAVSLDGEYFSKISFNEEDYIHNSENDTYNFLKYIFPNIVKSLLTK